MSFMRSSIEHLLVNYRSAFTQPSFENFASLAKSWILCSGRHSISRVIQFIPDRWGSSHSRFYSFFSRARWEPDDLCMQLVPAVLELIPDEEVIFASVDDTLAYRNGAHIWGAGMHFDALRSNYGRGSKRVASMAFGHSWVIVSLLVPAPWNRNRLLAVPVLFRIDRSKKTCPTEDYRKRSELAADLVELLCRWLPSNRHLRLLGNDRAYFITDPMLGAEQVIISYSHRWSQEVLHRNLEQHFGLDDPQNGWWRHPSGQRRDDRRPGPAPHESRGARAATRTAPFILVLYATVEIWYLTHGRPDQDVQRARQRAPWNIGKREPSFTDMLTSARREILFPGVFDGTASVSS